MRPILVNIPSKWLFYAALVLAVVTFVRDYLKRRQDPSRPRNTTPLYLLAGAEALIGFKSGSWVPSMSGLAQPWSPVPIYAYGVMLGTSLIVGWFLAMRLAKQDGVPQMEAGTIYMWTAVWSIIGARVLWFITTPGVSVWEIPLITRGGLVAYGGMIGGFLASWYGCWKRKIKLLRWADVAAPAVVLGTAITRIGCFLFGCDYGARSSLPWAIRFPGPGAFPRAEHGSPAWQHHVADLGLSRAAEWSYPVHPTQLYESAVGVLLFVMLMLIRHYRRFSGQVFLGWVLGYGIMRPLIEIVRDDDDRGLYTVPFTHLSLSTSQIIGIVSVVLGLVLLVTLVRRYRRDPEGSRLWLQPMLEPAAATVGVGAGRGGGSGGGSNQRKRRKRR
jgi:phosphatidylglycerol:prolipoprotein diacylglycerol transferase